MSIGHLLSMVEGYITKIASKSFGELDLKRHQAIYELVLQELRRQVTILQTISEERLLLQTVEENGRQKNSNLLESTSDYAKIVKEMTQWFRFAKEKFGISVR
jgi:hypothetical protein